MTTLQHPPTPCSSAHWLQRLEHVPGARNDPWFATVKTTELEEALRSLGFDDFPKVQRRNHLAARPTEVESVEFGAWECRITLSTQMGVSQNRGPLKWFVFRQFCLKHIATQLGSTIQKLKLLLTTGGAATSEWANLPALGRKLAPPCWIGVRPGRLGQNSVEWNSIACPEQKQKKKRAC